MVRRFIFIFVIVSLLSWTTGIAGQAMGGPPLAPSHCERGASGPGWSKPCTMDHTDSGAPRCPFCSTFISSFSYVGEGTVYDVPPPVYSSLIVSPETLSCPGFKAEIFRPPAFVV